jgi:hypothetical protein
MTAPAPLTAALAGRYTIERELGGYPRKRAYFPIADQRSDV